MTLNLAMTHRDGGARSARAPPRLRGTDDLDRRRARRPRATRLATIVAWRSCEHSAPVFEGTCSAPRWRVGATPRRTHGATLADLRAIVHADRGTGEPPEQVLDWGFVGVLA